MTQASMAPVRKCALLTRVSTTMQSRVEEGSLKNQLERLRAHIAYRNANYDERWVEIDTYEMKAVSGKDALRSKEFQRLFEDIRLKRVNVILAGSLDRVSRSVKDFQHLLEVLTKEEVELISLKETLDTSTAHGRFFVNLMASLAELERDRTAERNSATTLSRADRGLWNGGMLLGYDLGERKGSLVVNEREAEIVRTAFETYLQTGSILKTVTALNDRGFRTKGYSSRRGKTHPPKRFWYTSMRWLLCNPAYIAKKEVNKKKRNLDQSKLPESKRYRIVDANWPPILSKETFDKVQLLLGENLRSGHNRADTKKHVYLLQGLVTCGKCGGHMEGRSGTGRLGQRYYFYVCKNKDCGFRVAEKELLKVVLGRIGKIARSPRLLGTLVSITNENLHAEVPALQARKATLDREVNEIKGQAERLLDGVGLEGSEGEVFLKEKLSELGRRRAGLETTVAEIETTVEQIKRNAVNQEGVLASLGKFRSLYQALPPYQQREGIRLVIADVKISEEALEISIHGRPAPEEVLEKLRAPGMHSPRRSERSTWLPSRSATRTPFSVRSAKIQLDLCPKAIAGHEVPRPCDEALKSATPVVSRTCLAAHGTATAALTLTLGHRKGSIALIERLWRTLKDTLGLRLLRPLAAEGLMEKVELGLVHYAHFRPHQGLGGATPAEMYFGRTPAHLSAIPSPRGRPGEGPLDFPFLIDHLDAERLLPVLVRKAA